MLLEHLFPFLVPFLQILMHFPYFFHVVLVQTMSKSPRIDQNSVEGVCDVSHFDSFMRSRHVGINTGSDTGISPQIDIFNKEVICRVYQQKFGHIILAIL